MDPVPLNGPPCLASVEEDVPSPAATWGVCVCVCVVRSRGVCGGVTPRGGFPLPQREGEGGIEILHEWVLRREEELVLGCKVNT